MKIDIAHIAKLSRLHFEPEQIAKFEKDMESIVAMVDHLPDVSDTLTVDPNNAMRLREDVQKTTSSTAAAEPPEEPPGTQSRLCGLWVFLM